VDSLNDERKSINKSKQQLDDIMGMGDAIMESLRGQRSRLEGSSSRLESMAATLGISNSLVKTIQRTEWLDAKLVYAGMAITTLLLLGLWWYKG